MSVETYHLAQIDRPIGGFGEKSALLAQRSSNRSLTARSRRREPALAVGDKPSTDTLIE
jgi:hypothetical protein